VTDPGATVSEVEGVTQVVESRCRQAPHVAHLHGVSLEGLSLVTVEFERGTDANATFGAVRDQLRTVRDLLPPAANDPAIQRAPGPEAARYVFRSDVLPLTKLGDMVESSWSSPVAQTAGVGRVVECGDFLPRALVDVDATALAGTGLTITDVATALKAAISPGPGATAGLRVLVLGTANGAPIRLADVAKIVDAGAPPACRAYDEHGAVIETTVRIHQTGDVATVRAALGGLESKARLALPPGVTFQPRPVGRTLVVDLDPDVATASAITLRDVVGGVAGVGPFVVEIGPATDADPRAIARVLLASTDEGTAGRVLAALRNVPFVRGAGEPNATVLLRGADRAALATAAEALYAALAARGELVVRLGTDRHARPVPHVDEALARKLGVSMKDVQLALEARTGKTVATFLTDVRPAPVVLRIDAALDQVFLRGGAGLVPMSAFTSLRAEPVPAALLYEDGFPTVGARVRTKDASGLQHAYTPPADIELRVVPD